MFFSRQHHDGGKKNSGKLSGAFAFRGCQMGDCAACLWLALGVENAGARGNIDLSAIELVIAI